MSILLIFLDGVGVGVNDRTSNPFAVCHSLLSRFSEQAPDRLPPQFKKEMQNDASVLQTIVESDAGKRHPSFRAIFTKYCECLRAHEQEYMKGCDAPPEDQQKEGKTGAVKNDEVFRSIDARMGVPGIPQSATGQASLLTGLNVPEISGGHLAGLPNQRLREIISGRSILLRLVQKGLNVSFANAFTEAFFKRERPRISSTTQSALAAGLSLRLIDDVRNGRALYHDFTNFFLKEMGYDVDIFSPQKAGKILAAMAAKSDFTLYEYFITDIMGHKGELRDAVIEVAKINLFILTVLTQFDLQKNLVILTSDHGNLEDISIKTHTLNKVPLLCWGKGSRELAGRVENIAGIANRIISYFT